MKNTDSLKKNNDFRRVYNKGKSIANRQLVMYFMPNRQKLNRLGISVSKKVGNSVVRSRVTRLIKESYRLNEDNFEVGYDIVIIARNTMLGLDYWQTEKSLMHLFRKQSLLKKENVEKL
ncbi:MAG: ribonuclease P protein component [Lachnospirales bacterium]